MMNLKNDSLALWLLVASMGVNANDCDRANEIWKAMGGSTSIPNNCCGTNGIQCGTYAGSTTQRILQM